MIPNLRSYLAADSLAGKSGKHALILTLLSSILFPFLQIIPPRTAWIAFSYSQTWLITAAVDFLEKPIYQRDIVYSYVLIGATTLVYIGITVSCIYQYCCLIY